MVGAMDPYCGSLHCVHTLIVPLLTQIYKWVLVTEQAREGEGGQGAAEVTSIGALLIFFIIIIFYAHSQYHLKLPLKGPSQPHLCSCLHTKVWLLYFIQSMSKQRKSL